MKKVIITILLLFSAFFVIKAQTDIPDVWQKATGVPVPMSYYKVGMERDTTGKKKFYLFGFDEDKKLNLQMQVERITYSTDLKTCWMYYPETESKIILKNPIVK